MLAASQTCIRIADAQRDDIVVTAYDGKMVGRVDLPFDHRVGALRVTLVDRSAWSFIQERRGFASPDSTELRVNFALRQRLRDIELGAALVIRRV